MLKRLSTTTQAQGTIAAPTFGTAIDLQRAWTFSAQCVFTVNTPTPKTFAQGTRQIQIIDYVSDVAGSLNNKYYLLNSWNALTNASKGFYVWFNINGAGVDPAIAGRTAIPIAGATNATATTLVSATKTALDALTNDFASSTAATSHLTVNNGFPGAVTAAAEGLGTGFTFNAPSTAGVNAAVNPVADTFTIASHGYATGLIVRGTDTGTLPAGITTGVDYFAIVIDANTIQLATSLANATATTPVPINITDYGTNAGTGTLTATALASGTVQLQKSNDGTNWDVQGSAVTVSASGTKILDWTASPSTKYIRVAYSMASGSFAVTATCLVQGD